MMKYYSTRDRLVRMDSAEAIKMGLSRDGGLFLPAELPSLPDLKELASMRYQQRAAAIMSLFLDDFSHEELIEYAQNLHVKAQEREEEKLEAWREYPLKDRLENALIKGVGDHLEEDLKEP